MHAAHVVRLARADARPHLRVRLRRRRDDRLDRSQRGLRLRAASSRSSASAATSPASTGDELTTGGWGHFGAFPLPHDLERAGQGAVLVHGRTAARLLRRRARATRPSAIIDVHHPRIDARSATSTSGSFDAAQRPAPSSPASPSTSTRSRCSTATRTRSAARRPRDRRLVRAAQPRPPRHRDRQLRHAPPRPQHRRLPAQLRARAATTSRSGCKPRRDRARGQGPPPFFTTAPFVRAARRRRRHRRPGAGARRAARASRSRCRRRRGSRSRR